MITADESLAKAQAILAEERLEALVVASPVNVRYLAGTSFLTMRTIPDRLGIVVVTPERQAFIYCSIEEGHARQESWLTELVPYTEFKDPPMSVLAAWLRGCGITSGRVGVELGYLTARHHRELERALPGVRPVGVDASLDQARAIKTPAEIATIKDIARATDASIRAAFERARAGMTERELAEIMLSEARGRGARTLIHQVLATGANGFKAHAAPGATPLAPGDVVRTDFGMVWQGEYLSDVAKTAFVGEPSRAQRDVYARLEEVHQIVARSMRGGVRARDVFRLCAELMEDAGLDFWAPHIGHSIGLGLHENPMLQPFEETALEVGMVFMLEPLVTGPDGYYHVEDLIIVGPDSGEIVSRAADWSVPMAIGH
ncbi:M24 family metallopeptidase [Nonomuraea lactucae]|uniref:M24 family metallopeptidase n=1 Tax=Nonomuraea lactucae TaxID=2249762 RepID=UPI000DE50939|nr:Xaa-Pro peptidase family protein [Nonomuraea lactucae]